jgi:hypothetical protein
MELVTQALVVVAVLFQAEQEAGVWVEAQPIVPLGQIMAEAEVLEFVVVAVAVAGEMALEEVVILKATAE